MLKHSNTYRPEIDGLRALAVLPVIFFHAGFDLFSGGFIGVDIFFVISGYLISTIIINEVVNNKFSLITFYERRCRRILPALFFIILTCLPFAWFWLPPSELESFGGSILAVSLFVSNIFFWLESGYFDAAVELKPLIHTWSLGVEEQFYILFPIFLIFVWRFGIRNIILIFISIFFASLILSHWAAYNKPSANFYWLPSRAWELLIGVLAAFFVMHKKLTSKPICEFLSLLGISMIAYSILTFDSNTPLPSLFALIPTLGTVFIIISTNEYTIISKLLSKKIFVGLGLISYSLYLWHQPIFAFTRHTSLDEISLGHSFFLILLSLILAFISWKWVESPFRRKDLTSKKFIFSFSISGILFFLMIGLFISSTNGLKDYKLKYEFNDSERMNYSIISNSTGYDLYDFMQSKDCHMWVPVTDNLVKQQVDKCFREHGSPIIILGDSHAMNIYNIFSKSNRYRFLIGISQGGCRPHTYYPNCQYDQFLKFIDQNSTLNPTVIYHQSGSYFVKDRRGNYEPPFDRETIFDSNHVIKVAQYLDLVSLFSSHVIWLGHFTEYRVDPLRDISKIYEVPKISFVKFNQIEVELQKLLTDSNNFSFIPFRNFFDIPSDPIIEDNCFMWMDTDHFSLCGENYIAFNAVFDSLPINSAK